MYLRTRFRISHLGSWHVCVGHAKIDFTVLRNSSALLRMWATDLSVGPSLALAAFQLFDFLSAGDFAPRSGIYSVSSGSSTASSTGDLGPDSLNNEAAMNDHVHVEERCYVSCEMVAIQDQSVGFEGVLQVPFFSKPCCCYIFSFDVDFDMLFDYTCGILSLFRECFQTCMLPELRTIQQIVQPRVT